MIRALFLWILLASCGMAQIEIAIPSEEVFAVAGLVNPKTTESGAVIVGEGSVPRVVKACYVQVKTDAKFIDLFVRKPMLELASFYKVSDKVWLIADTGKLQIEVVTFDPEKGIQRAIKNIERGEPLPPPKPVDPVEPDKPVVPVPPDMFDNLGQRVAVAAKGLPKVRENAENFAWGANELRSNPAATINTVAAAVVAKRGVILSSEAAKWDAMISMLNEDMKKRWPMDKMTMADWYDAIAKGLR